MFKMYASNSHTSSYTHLILAPGLILQSILAYMTLAGLLFFVTMAMVHTTTDLGARRDPTTCLLQSVRGLPVRPRPVAA